MKAGIGFLLSSLRLNKARDFILYLLILFLPTQLGRHFWPEFSFVRGIRVDYLSPTLYLTDILILFIFVFWIFSKKKFLISNFKFLIKFQFLKSKIPILIFTLFLISGMVLSKSPVAGFFGLLKLLEFSFLGFYIATNINKVKFQNILLMFSIGIIFESFLSISQYFNHGSLQGIFYFFGERFFNSQTPGIANASLGGELFLRPYGTFPHPNVLAGYLVIGMILIIFNFKFSIKSKFSIFNFKTFLLVMSLIIGTVALFLTLSRVAIVLWVLILGFLLIRKLIINHSSLIILVLVGLLLLGLTTPLGLRFTGMRLTDESIVQRESLIQSSIAMIKNNPVFGVGLNNFLVNLPSYQAPHASLFYLQPVHNIFLLVLSETGIVGLVFFIWFLIKTFSRIKNHESRIKGWPIIHNSLFIILSSILILGMFDHYFLTLQQGQLLFSFILGFCWADKLKN